MSAILPNQHPSTQRCALPQVCVVVESEIITTGEAALVGQIRRSHSGGRLGIRITTALNFTQDIATLDSDNQINHGECQGTSLIVVSADVTTGKYPLHNSITRDNTSQWRHLALPFVVLSPR